MKTLLIVLCLPVLLSCGKKEETTGTTNNSLTVKDAGSQTLGTLVYWHITYAIVQSPKGYFYIVYYDGTLRGAANIFFSDPSCAGNVYLATGSGQHTASALGVGPDGTIYVATTSDADGTLPSGATQSYQSMSSYATSCSATSGTVVSVLATTITRAAAGIPETITAPLVFED